MFLWCRVMWLSPDSVIRSAVSDAGSPVCPSRWWTTSWDSDWEQNMKMKTRITLERTSTYSEHKSFSSIELNWSESTVWSSVGLNLNVPHIGWSYSTVYYCEAADCIKDCRNNADSSWRERQRQKVKESLCLGGLSFNTRQELKILQWNWNKRSSCETQW